MIRNGAGRKIDMVMPVIMSAIMLYPATRICMCPEAIGLCFFSGCLRSASRSMRSFRIYMPDATRLKAMNASVTLKNGVRLSIL